MLSLRFVSSPILTSNFSRTNRVPCYRPIRPWPRFVRGINVESTPLSLKNCVRRSDRPKSPAFGFVPCDTGFVSTIRNERSGRRSRVGTCEHDRSADTITAVRMDQRAWLRQLKRIGGRSYGVSTADPSSKLHVRSKAGLRSKASLHSKVGPHSKPGARVG